MFWTRKQALQLEPADAAIIERLLTGDVGKQLRTEAAEELRAERQTLLDEIKETQALIERDGPALQNALSQAEADLERAERVATAARAQRLAAVSAVMNFSSRTERKILAAQAKLRATAHPGIAELALELDRNHDHLRCRTTIETRAGGESDPEATGPHQRVRLFASRASAIAARMELLEALRDECRALALTFAGDPSQALDDIRRRIPASDAPFPIEHRVEQKIRPR